MFNSIKYNYQLHLFCCNNVTPSLFSAQNEGQIVCFFIENSCGFTILTTKSNMACLQYRLIYDKHQNKKCFFKILNFYLSFKCRYINAFLFYTNCNFSSVVLNSI